MQDFSTKRPVCSYIIRLWAEFDGADWVWRVSLQPTQSGEWVVGFSCMETAVEYLTNEMQKAEKEYLS